MKCIVKTASGPGNLALQEKPIPVPGPGEVLARVRVAAICGTDLHIKHWAEFAARRMTPPTTIGHEFCGEIVEVGAGIDPSRIGETVSAESHIACHQCAMCLDSKAQLCLRTKAFGLHVDGCFAEYAALPSENAVVCNPAVSDENNALLEPLGTVVQAATKVAAAGKIVAVTGCGPMGLMAISVFKKMGARRIICVELNAYRAEAAKRMGADVILNPTECDVEKAVRDHSDGLGPDILAECSGSSAAIRAAARYISAGGEWVQIALPDGEVPFNFTDVFYRGIHMYGVSGREMFHTWKVMNGLLEAGMDVSGCVSHVLPMAEYARAFALLEDGNALKVLLRP